MPELPEVTTIANQLQKEIVGSIIIDVQSVGGYKTQPEFGELKRRSQGSKVLSVERAAKTIVIGLSDKGEVKSNKFVVIHLAMTGRLLLRPPEFKPDPWTRLVFRIQPVGLDSTRRVRELRFCDSRMFGYVKLLTRDELDAHTKRYGPDALDPKLTPIEFLRELRRRKTAVKRALLEQDLLAGVGNLYANDALWLAQIHPETPTQNITINRAAKLLESVRIILEESISRRGSTLGDKMYIDLYGQEGEHQNHFRVYDKADRPCSRCSFKISFKEIGGRGTFFCSKCQVKSDIFVLLKEDDPPQTKLL